MLSVNVSGGPEKTLMEISGRIDSMNANQLGEALNREIEGGHVRLVLDLSQVEYMSSAGLRELVSALKKVRGTGDLRLARPSPRVQEVLEMAGLDTIFQIFASRDIAMSSFQP